MILYHADLESADSVHHEGDNFSNSAKSICLGVGEFLLSLMGCLCMDPC